MENILEPIKGNLKIASRVRRQSQHAFTLVELLIALALTGMAISVVGGIIISQLRENVAQERQKQLIDDWSLVATFINEDIFAAERAYPIEDLTAASRVTSLASNGVCGYTADQIKLALVQDDASTFITYAIIPIADSEKMLWRGPYLLKRCGPLNINSKFEDSNSLSNPNRQYSQWQLFCC